jgi:hypothetical protein
MGSSCILDTGRRNISMLLGLPRSAWHEAVVASCHRGSLGELYTVDSHGRLRRPRCDGRAQALQHVGGAHPAHQTTMYVTSLGSPMRPSAEGDAIG